MGRKSRLKRERVLARQQATQARRSEAANATPRCWFSKPLLMASAMGLSMLIGEQLYVNNLSKQSEVRLKHWVEESNKRVELLAEKEHEEQHMKEREGQLVKKIKENLSRSEATRPYLDFLEKNGIKITFSDLGQEKFGHYASDANTVILNSRFTNAVYLTDNRRHRPEEIAHLNDAWITDTANNSIRSLVHVLRNIVL